MKYRIPDTLSDSIMKGNLKSLDTDFLRRHFGGNLPAMKLFGDIDTMEAVADQLDAAGYVDDPEFCMARETTALTDDRRLIFERALFIAGSIVPGDDVFIAVDLGSQEVDPPVFVFDWDRNVPERWVKREHLSELLRECAMKR